MESENNVIAKTNSTVDPVKTGKFIRELRLSHNLTQEALGDKLFITRKAVSKWETGNACPSIDLLKSLSVIFNVSVEELMNGEFSNPELNIHNKSFSYRMLHSKSFKLSILLTSIILFLTLLIFYFENHNTTSVYTIYYEDDNFAISNGTIVFSKSKEYIHLGYLENNLNDVNDKTEFDYTLYIKNNKNKETILLSFSSNQLSHFGKEGYSELDSSLLKNNLNNLNLKISYTNNKNEEKEYILKLESKLNYKNNDDYDFIKNKKDSILTNNNNFSSLTDKKEETTEPVFDENSEYIKISIEFMYKLSDEELKKKYDNKSIEVDGENFNISIEEKHNIKIENNKYIVCLYLKEKRIYILNLINNLETSFYNIDGDKNILLINDINKNLITEIIEKIKKI